MKKYFLYTCIVLSSFLFAACTLPKPDGSSQTDLQGNSLGNVQLSEGTSGIHNLAEKEVIPQIAIPQDTNAFVSPLNEQAKEAGVTQKDVEAVRAKIAESFQMDIAEVQITAEAESTPTFMTGYVNVGEGEKGGIYFAAKTEKGWEIAYNGIGIVTCEAINKYDFPAGMVPRCYDSATGANVDR